MATAKKVIPIKSFTSWSWSRYQDWVKCPLRAKLKHIDKIKEPSNDAMERGTAIHTMAEEYVLGKLRTLPTELRAFKDEFSKLKKLYKSKSLPLSVEGDLAFTKDWTTTKWDDWNGAWVRIKIDCEHFATPTLLILTDYKTGKMDERNTAEYMLQLQLYAVSGLVRYSHIKNLVVQPRILYLDHGVEYPPPGEQVQYTLNDLKKLLKDWAKRVTPMFAERRFAPKPNSSCRWCYFSKAKNGNCKF